MPPDLKEAAKEGKLAALGKEKERKGLFPKFREKKAAKKEEKGRQAQLEEGKRDIARRRMTEPDKQRQHERELAEMESKSKRRSDALKGAADILDSPSVLSKYT